MAATLVLIFGEDENDRRALEFLIKAIVKDPSRLRTKRLRNPVILRRDAVQSGKYRQMANDIYKLWNIERVSSKKTIVVVHKDCDACEDAHLLESNTIEKQLLSMGVSHIVPATPAWEMETWMMMFPDAIAAIRACWRRPPKRTNVGNIINAKEQLRRELRPTLSQSQARCPDYTESDAPQIAEKVFQLGIDSCKAAGSKSFDVFAKKLIGHFPKQKTN
jgi:hypothetical protein